MIGLLKDFWRSNCLIFALVLTLTAFMTIGCSGGDDGGGDVSATDVTISNSNELRSLTPQAAVRDLKIVGSADLLNLMGLEPITTVQRDLIIQFNTSLESLDGLDNISSIGRDIIIEDNDALTSLDGLNSLNRFGDYGGIQIINNNNLENINALINITRVGGHLEIGNNSLSTLQGLNNLSVVNSSLSINESYVKNLDQLSNLTSVQGHLSLGPGIVGGNYMSLLESVEGLSNLTSIGSSLRISETSALKTLQGLNNLVNVGEIDIRYNSGLENIQALGKIVRIGDTRGGNVHNLKILYNDSLTTLGLDSLSYVAEHFYIYNNPLLPTSLAESLRNQVLAADGIGGEIKIYGNKDG